MVLFSRGNFFQEGKVCDKWLMTDFDRHKWAHAARGRIGERPVLSRNAYKLKRDNKISDIHGGGGLDARAAFTQVGRDWETHGRRDYRCSASEVINFGEGAMWQEESLLRRPLAQGRAIGQLHPRAQHQREAQRHFDTCN